jgi:hypothetical protein
LVGWILGVRGVNWLVSKINKISGPYDANDIEKWRFALGGQEDFHPLTGSPLIA